MPIWTSGMTRARNLVGANAAAMVAIGLRLFAAFASFVIISLVARSAGPAVTGDYAMAVATSVLASLIAALGMEPIVTRIIAGDLREGKEAAAWAALMRVTRIIAPMSLVAAVVLFLLSPMAPRIGATVGPMQVIALSVATFPMLRLAVAALRSTGSILWSQWFDGAHSFFILAAVGYVMLNEHSINALGLAWFYSGAVAITAVWSWGVLLWRTRAWPRDGQSTDPLMQASWKILVAGISQSMTQWVVLAALGAMLGAAQVGAFRVANQIVLIIALMLTTIEAFVSPQLAGDFRVRDIGGAWARHRRATWLMCAITVPPALACLLFPDFILRQLFGAEFAIAAAALVILVCAQLINAATGPIGGVMVMSGHERLSLQLAIGGLVIATVLSLTLIGPIGLAGGALALAAALAFRNLMAFVVMRRRLPE